MLPAGRRSPLTTSRRCALVLAACLAASCSHGQGLLGKAEGSFRERDYDDALARYRKLGGEECSPEGSSRLCCAGLLGEAESLLAINERQAALKAFEHCRQECPTNPDVRRKQYLAEHATDPEPEGASATITFTTEHVLGGLSERARIIWLGIFLDGEVVGREPLSVRPGAHELEAEALVEAPGGKGLSSRPVHLRARQPLNVSAHGALTPHVRLTLGERPDASLPEDRTTLEMMVSGAPPVHEQPSPRPAGLGIELRMSGSDPKFPPEFVQRGSGWRVRTEICVAPDGRVQAIQFVDTAPAHDPVVDATILETVRRWRYGAYKVDGALHGFCHLHEVDLAR